MNIRPSQNGEITLLLTDVGKSCCKYILNAIPENKILTKISEFTFNISVSHNPKNILLYYIPITDTTLELSVFWPSDTESRINELRFSESISLSFKTRLTSVTCFCGDVT